MKKATLIAVGFLMVFALSISAYAGDVAPKANAQPVGKAAAPVAAPATSTAAPAPAAAKSTSPTTTVAPKKEKPKGVEAVVEGKIETKMAKNKKGKEVTHCLIVVSSAQGTDGKAIDALKGKTLRVVGKKIEEVKKHAGKSVKITGEVFENKRLRADTIK